MWALLAFASAGLGADLAIRSNSNITWEAYVRLFENKIYAPAEAKTRRAIFERKRQVVLAQNTAYEKGDSTWWAAINQFSDQTAEEFKRWRRGAFVSPSARGTESVEGASASTNPAEADWRSVQTGVKNQKDCGGCWAFAATEVIESHFAIAQNRTAPVLSPQTFINCVENPQSCGGTGGCEGATAEMAFNFTRGSGIARESELPFRDKDEKCRRFKPAVGLDSFVRLPQNSASALETTLAQIGPVAVTVCANWDDYGGGVFSGGCKMPVIWKSDVCNLDHAVVAVGYGVDKGERYWLIRNSWGPHWGEKGYIRLTRKHDKTKFRDDDPASGDACKPAPKHQYPMGESGVLFDTSYPTGVKEFSSE